MSSIFVPEVAASEAKAKFPKIFDQAISKIKQLKKEDKTDRAVAHIVSREEEIWTVWTNLCKATRD